MAHLAEGVLRRLLDEPAGVSERERGHVADCPPCLDRLARVRADADAAGTALGPVPDVDVDAAWQRHSSARAGGAAVLPLHRPARRRGLLRRPAVAGLAVAVVLAGAGTAAAGGWLQVFRAEQVAPVSLRASDLVALPDLSAYGDVELTGSAAVREVADTAAAAAATGLDVPEVADLPRGVGGAPQVQVGDRVSALFTFSTARAARAARAAGEPVPDLPTGLDGSRVRLAAGPGVAQVWQSGSGAPALLVARAVAPTASTDGLPFATVRDALLSLPGLPDQVADQLRSFAGNGSTLPLLVPADRVRTSSARVDGTRATVLSTRDQALAAVVWVQDGVLTVVAGSLGEDEVLAVARGLR